MFVMVLKKSGDHFKFFYKSPTKTVQLLSHFGYDIHYQIKPGKGERACGVCGDKTNFHEHYGAVVCHPCRIFFRLKSCCI